MIEKAKCIALHSVRYGESSLIAYLYSLEFGRITVMVNGAYKSGKSAKKAIFFQPLSLLNIVFYPGKNQGICRLKEVSTYFSPSTIHTNPLKTSISLFISEIIYRGVREEEANPALYGFIEKSILALDTIEKGTPNFHLLFLTHLSRFLGFYPNGRFSDLTPYFDYKNGVFVSSKPSHPMYFDREISNLISLALSTTYEESQSLTLNGKQRKTFLEMMLTFYSYHLEALQTIRSLTVLSQVFEE